MRLQWRDMFLEARVFKLKIAMSDIPDYDVSVSYGCYFWSHQSVLLLRISEYSRLNGVSGPQPFRKHGLVWCVLSSVSLCYTVRCPVGDHVSFFKWRLPYIVPRNIWKNTFFFFKALYIHSEAIASLGTWASMCLGYGLKRSLFFWCFWNRKSTCELCL